MKRILSVIMTLMIAISPLRADDNHYTPVDVSQYQNNGNITAVVFDAQGNRMTDVEVAVYNGTACRSTTRSNSQGMLYITTFGDSKFNIVFHLYDHATGQETIVNQQLQYTTNMTVGSYDSPYRITWENNPCDTNRDGTVSIGDVTYVIEVLKGDSDTYGTADANQDGSVTLDDVTFICDAIIKIKN